MRNRRQFIEGCRLSGKPSKRSLPSGFALIITISLMLLLVLLAVGLLSLSSVTLRTSQQSIAQSEARENARMALSIAIGELQKTLGSDRAVSAPASILGESIPGRHWTGAWGKDEEGLEVEPVWLVSGENPDPQAEPSGETIEIVRLPDEQDSVSVERVLLKEGGNEDPHGAYAYWIGDEGVKARVDLSAPGEEDLTEPERYTRAYSAQETNIATLGEAFERFSRGEDSEENLERRSLISMATVNLSVDDELVDQNYFHDLTTGGESLPVNVVDGGMKVDLSRVFDRSRTSQRRLFPHYFGASWSTKSVGAAKLQEFTVQDPSKFYFVEELTRGGTLEVGPNWGILCNYHRLWENMGAPGGRRSQTSMPILPIDPKVETDIKSNTWSPYSAANGPAFKRDVQHHNSSVTPVVSLLQMGFRLKTERVSVPPPSGRGRPTISYKVQLEFKPMVGLWNPYNVPISSAPYRFDWALYPYLRFGYGPASSNATTGARRVWMRRHWKAGPSNENEEGSAVTVNKWFQLETSPVDLQPGEFRLFSVDEQASINRVNTLYPRWNDTGAIVFDVVDSNNQQILVPPNHVIWIGDLFLEDGQHPETEAEFPDVEDDVTASWFTLKSPFGRRDRDALILSRYSDIWVPGTGDRTRVMVPEQVVSGWDGRSTTKDRRPVEELAVEGNHHHVATWAFGLRASAMTEEGQTLRGYVDSNVRALAANPVWDGSRPGRRANDGWSFISPMMGGSHPEAERGEVGDGGPPGRGLIAEAAVGDQTPQTPGGDRFQGYGGPYNTAAGGQTHVALFDVPRMPPVSIGQLQHAQLSRYNFEPTFVLGNSYASSRVPLGQTVQEDFMDIPDFTMADISYLVNEEIWDGYFYSTLSSDYLGETGSLDSEFGFEELVEGERQLPNPRMKFRAQAEDESLDAIINEARERGAEAISARLAVEGAFNVNSTSVDAWKAVLSSLSDFEFPVVDLETGEASWESDSSVRFARFGHVLSKDSYQKGVDGSETSFWQSYREIEPDELDSLAEEIVVEVRERGPFRSFAEFVNRDPERASTQLKGALQAALDRTVNADLPETIGLPAEKPEGDHFVNAVDGESSALGHAAYVMQGDVLQALAPVLNVRSDYFRVRAYGDARDVNGNVIATARCEAFIQRRAELLDPTDPIYVPFDELQSPVNKLYGRRFEMVSFRWLSTDEA